MLLRRLALSGDYADSDWLNPANVPPDNAGAFRVTGDQVLFALRGKASAADDAAIVDLGTLTVDAYVVEELPGGGFTRGQSIVEAQGQVLAGEVKMVSNDVTRGSRCYLHLDLTNVGALAAVDVVLVSGARRL